MDFDDIEKRMVQQVVSENFVWDVEKTYMNKNNKFFTDEHILQYKDKIEWSFLFRHKKIKNEETRKTIFNYLVEKLIINVNGKLTVNNTYSHYLLRFFEYQKQNEEELKYYLTVINDIFLKIENCYFTMSLRGILSQCQNFTPGIVQFMYDNSYINENKYYLIKYEIFFKHQSMPEDFYINDPLFKLCFEQRRVMSLTEYQDMQIRYGLFSNKVIKEIFIKEYGKIDGLYKALLFNKNNIYDSEVAKIIFSKIMNVRNESLKKMIENL